MLAPPDSARWVALALPFLTLASGAEVVERSLRVEGRTAEDGSAVTLEWWQDEPAGPDPVVVSRRLLGQEGAGTWVPLATVAGPTFTDATTAPGTAYEYQVHRSPRASAPDPVEEAAGYWVAGAGVPATLHRGVALLVVDETIASPLAGEIDRLEMDLAGDGWSVVRRDQARHGAPSGGGPAALRQWIAAEHAKQPATPHAIFLLGRVPYVMSGWDAPDEHEPEPHATDLYYADVDGRWTDAENLGPGNTPGDGRFDQSYVPTTTPGAGFNERDAGNGIEMWVGRVDLAGLPSFARSEVELLRAYLDRNHAWRHRRFEPPVNAYWDYLAFDESPAERFGLANIAGPGALSRGSHAVEGQREPALWGIDFGDWNGSNYAGYSIKSVFAINFGSAKQMWQSDDNAMRAMLAQPWYVLACGWGVRPNWHIHPMGLGLPIGYCHRRIVNNRFDALGRLDYLQHDDFGNSQRHAVWINLMGDPTLHAFPAAPPSGVTATAITGGVRLDWTAPAGAIGHLVLRASDRLGPYVALNGGQPVTGNSFTDPSATGDEWYMVRALHLENVVAGSFENLSQGAFARVGNSAPSPATAPTASTRPGRPIEVPLAATDPDGDHVVLAKAAAAENGTVVDEGDRLVYTPATDFWGATDTLRFSLWDGTTATTGEVAVTVLPPSIPPTILTTGGSISARAGDNAVLHAEVAGDLPMQYRWFRDGVALSDGPDFSGSNTATLTVIAAKAENTGSYHIEATNPVGQASGADDPLRLVVVEESIGDSLVLHYDFDDVSGGRIDDRSPSGNDHGLDLPGAPWSAAGRFGGAFGDAAGASDVVPLDIPDAADLDFDPQGEAFTISLWLRSTSPSAYAGIFHKEQIGPDRRQYKLWTLDPPTLLQFYAGDAEGKLDTAATAAPLDDGAWHLLTFVNRNVGGIWKATLYYDDGSSFTEIDSGAVLVPGAPLRIAADKAWRGQLDDLRIHRRALTPSEVAALYQGLLPVVPTYAEWAAGIDWNGRPSGPADDADGNGVANALEFRLARDPLSGSPLFADRRMIRDGGTDWWQLDFRRRSIAPRAVPHFSEDLAAWRPLVIDGVDFLEETIDPDPLGDGRAEDIRLKLRLEAAPARFLRLEPYR